LDRAWRKFEALSARLVLIGQATPNHAARFRRQLRLELPVLADERRESYKAAGTKIANASELVGPKMIAKGALATVRVRRLQTRPIGHAAQLGGAMLILPDGRVAWSHLSEDASDNAAPQEILAALRAHAASARDT
jgi:peroxiredoxin